jgi:ribosomal protein L37AE/L43A
MGNRVYEGRFKGSTSTHMPNNKFREEAERMGLGGHVVACETCGRLYKGTRMECKIWTCTCTYGDAGENG